MAKKVDLSKSIPLNFDEDITIFNSNNKWFSNLNIIPQKKCSKIDLHSCLIEELNIDLTDSQRPFVLHFGSSSDGNVTTHIKKVVLTGGRQPIFELEVKSGTKIDDLFGKDCQMHQVSFHEYSQIGAWDVWGEINKFIIKDCQIGRLSLPSFGDLVLDILSSNNSDNTVKIETLNCISRSKSDATIINIKGAKISDFTIRDSHNIGARGNNTLNIRTSDSTIEILSFDNVMINGFVNLINSKFHHIKFIHFQAKENLTLDNCQMIQMNSKSPRMFFRFANIQNCRFTNFYLKNTVIEAYKDSSFQQNQMWNVDWPAPKYWKVDSYLFYQQIKRDYQALTDKPNEIFFRGLELAQIKKEAQTRKEKLRLFPIWVSGVTNSFGQNWVRPTLILLFLATIFSIVLYFNYDDKKFWHNFFAFIPLSKNVPETANSNDGLYGLFMSIKLINSFFLYQAIMAFRLYFRK